MDIKFNVSAKTARLIGRENIADVDGAVIELVKNSYDADASCCFIKFDIPFPNINISYKNVLLKSLLKDDDYKKVMSYCDTKEDIVVKKDSLTMTQEKELEKILFQYNKIILADNGHGMTKSIFESAWMNIGTDDKEKNYSSEKGRIKTGAKGIGRFALDKLSTSSMVYSKHQSDFLYKWFLNWDDFEHAELLSDVTAHMDIETNCNFKDIVFDYFFNQKDALSNYNWDCGTIIILSPLREPWNERLFNKVNRNMNSLNPLNNVDIFDVHLFNEYYNSFTIKQESCSINRNDYDYKLSIIYDGNDNIVLSIDRNEIDINLNKVIVPNLIGDKSYELDLNDFWHRERFMQTNYNRCDYDKEIIFKLSPLDFYHSTEEIDSFVKIGAFSFNLFFLKADNSTIEIVKKIPVRSRKNLLALHSGIKIYRDNFKVRPYGDDGPLYDWLNLSKRSQLSPAGVTHQSGSWRVEPYQVIGNLKISRIDNPRLEDMANREAIALNDTYYLLVDFLKKAIERFEFDRQYVLREYASWTKEEINKREPLKEKIVSQVKRKRNNKKENTHDYTFTAEQYENVIDELTTTDDNEVNAKQLLMMFSSSGIMTSTFSHELHRVSTDLGSRSQILRSCIKRIVQPDMYNGDPDFNPYHLLENFQTTDELLSSWVGVIMDGIKGDSLQKNVLDMSDAILNIIIKWKPLLKTKRINLLYEKNESIMYSIAVADLYLIINNFILNSAWFLEKTPERMISVELIVDEKSINLILKNNGEKLDNKYRDNPYRIFNLGETSKYKINKSGKEEKAGTGIGLWIIDQCVRKYNGQIEVLLDIDGFGFIVKFPRG